MYVPEHNAHCDAEQQRRGATLEPRNGSALRLAEAIGSRYRYEASRAGHVRS
jgi:hypothetical protein